MNRPTKTRPASLEAARLSNREVRVYAKNPKQPLDMHLINDTGWIELPFNSYSMQIRYGSMMEKLLNEKAFLRLAGINQLQHLVPSSCLDAELKKIPFFPHTRLAHSKIVAALGLVLLNREGYSQAEQLLFAVAAAYHDVATPAYGDTAIRIDRGSLCEEKNFAKIIADNGLDKRWRFLGFDLKDASEWISGQGKFGPLLDILDKISYTILDVYFLIRSGHAPKTLTSLVESDELFGDIWQSISLKDGQPHFNDVPRLLRFLQLRAIMHDQLYRNPLCRKLELVYSRAIENLYRNNTVSADDLMSGTDPWLDQMLDPIDHASTLRRIKHRHFRKQELCDAYGQRLNGRFIFTEYSRPFSTGLSWPVKHRDSIIPLSNAIDSCHADNLDRLSRHREGWHTFFYA